jgi:glycosyltransferase involved in cell wall biosynthesis
LDLQKFHPHRSLEFELDLRKKLHLPSIAPIILHAGRLDADKGVDKVIRAAAPAILKSEAHLLVVGDGSQKSRLLHLCRELDVEKKVHFTGFIHPSTMPEVYNLADIFVTASEIETQGIVLLEAAASGLPIVAVNATCISEIVHDHVNGFLIKPNDIQSFSDAIITLVGNLNRAQVMGREGRLLAEEHDIHRTWIFHEKLYLEMVRQTSVDRTAKREKFPNQWDIIKKIFGIETET